MNKKILFLLASMVFVSCTTLEDLKRVKPIKSEFDQALFNHYAKFAEAEAEKFDWVDSQYFINKAFKVAYGKYAPPEEIHHWKIPETYQETLKQARSSLLHVINAPNLKQQHPQLAASAQFYFDCWLEEQEENWQDDEISYCKESFYKTMSDLNAVITEFYKNNPSQKISSTLNSPSHKIPYTFQDQLDKLSKVSGDKHYIPSFEGDEENKSSTKSE